MSFQTRRVKEEKPRRHWPWKRWLVAALSLSRPLLGLYESWKKQHDEEVRSKKRTMLLKRILLIIVAAFIVIILLAGVVRALVAVRILNVGTIATIAGTPPPQDEHGFTNILLLGEGDATHDGKDLTDTVIVASVDPDKTQSVVMLSLPRDLYFLSTEKMGKGRLNSMYRDYKGYLRSEGMEEEQASLEAMKELAAEIGRILDLSIHHVIKVNFSGFEGAVDALGGVDIDVPYDIVDAEYPDEQYGYDPFEIRAGPQHLDGATALKYVRSRHTSSDFGRSARQQQLIAALGEKAKISGIAANPSAITDLYKVMEENVETTLGIRDIIGLAGLASTLDRSRVITMQLNDRNALYSGLVEPGGFLYDPPRNLFGGASVLLPVSIPEFPVTWRQIKALSLLLFQMRSSYLAHPTIAIFNAGAPSGHARKLATELIRYGFDVTTIENAPIEKIDASVIAGRPEGQGELATYFASLLKMNAAPLPAGFPPEAAEDVTIVLGKDYGYRPLQDFLPSGS